MHLKYTMIKCRCKSSSKCKCRTNLCSCKKNRLKCMSPLLEKCPNTEFFLVRSSFYLRIQSEYRKIRTRKNPVFGHFSRSAVCREGHGEDCNNRNVNKLSILFANSVNGVLYYIISLR